MHLDWWRESWRLIGWGGLALIGASKAPLNLSLYLSRYIVKAGLSFTATASLSWTKVANHHQESSHWSLASMLSTRHLLLMLFWFHTTRSCFSALSMHKASRRRSDHALTLHNLARTLHNPKTPQMVELCTLGLSRSVQVRTNPYGLALTLHTRPFAPKHTSKSLLDLALSLHSYMSTSRHL